MKTAKVKEIFRTAFPEESRLFADAETDRTSPSAGYVFSDKLRQILDFERIYVVRLDSP
jgi:hypothetical protein